jgi:hypothetical protein
MIAVGMYMHVRHQTSSSLELQARKLEHMARARFSRSGMQDLARLRAFTVSRRLASRSVGMRVLAQRS